MAAPTCQLEFDCAVQRTRLALELLSVNCLREHEQRKAKYETVKSLLPLEYEFKKNVLNSLNRFVICFFINRDLLLTNL